jgi:hypothetical protein
MAEIKKRAVVKDISLERFVSIVETYRRDHSLDQKTMCKLLGVTTHGWIKKVADKEVPVTEIPLNNLIEITGFPREYFMDLDPERPQEPQEPQEPQAPPRLPAPRTAHIPSYLRGFLCHIFCKTLSFLQFYLGCLFYSSTVF